jgi:hypothetical protein
MGRDSLIGATTESVKSKSVRLLTNINRLMDSGDWVLQEVLIDGSTEFCPETQKYLPFFTDCARRF